MSVGLVRLIMGVLPGKAAVVVNVLTVQVVSVTPVRLILTVLTSNVAVTANVNRAPIAGALLVPSTLIAGTG